MDLGFRSIDFGKVFFVINVKYLNLVCCIFKIIFVMLGVLSLILVVVLFYIYSNNGFRIFDVEKMFKNRSK